jgi:hypothetical protein
MTNLAQETSTCPEPGCGLQVWNYAPGTIRCSAGHVYQRAGAPPGDAVAAKLEAIRQQPCEWRHWRREDFIVPLALGVGTGLPLGVVIGILV